MNRGRHKPIIFGSWRDGVGAHLGRLLAYVLAAGMGIEEHAALIATALDWAPMPSERRRAAPRPSYFARNK